MHGRSSSCWPDALLPILHPIYAHDHAHLLPHHLARSITIKNLFAFSPLGCRYLSLDPLIALFTQLVSGPGMHDPLAPHGLATGIYVYKDPPPHLSTVASSYDIDVEPMPPKAPNAGPGRWSSGAPPPPPPPPPSSQAQQQVGYVPPERLLTVNQLQCGRDIMATRVINMIMLHHDSICISYINPLLLLLMRRMQTRLQPPNRREALFAALGAVIGGAGVASFYNSECWGRKRNVMRI